MGDRKTDMKEELEISFSESGFDVRWPDGGRSNACALFAVMPDFTMQHVSDAPGGRATANLPAGAVGLRMGLFSENGMPLRYSRAYYMQDMVPGMEAIGMRFLESYGGKTSLSLQHAHPCDLYRIYLVRGDGTRELATESEVWHVVSDAFEPGCVYEAFGYVRNGDGGYSLSAFSGRHECRPERPVPDVHSEVTVVIPVYNAAYALPRLLDSILASSFHKTAVVLSDDGSTDESISVCAWYAERYESISVVSGPNGGPAEARMRGLSRVSTEWTMMADADDVLHPYMLQHLYGAAMSSGADVAVSHVRTLDGVGSVSYPLRHGGDAGRPVVYTYEETVMHSVRHDAGNIFFVALWNKIMRTDIYRKIPEGVCPRRHYNDIGYTMTLYSYAEKIAYVRDAVYAWDKRNRATVGSMSTFGYKGAKNLWDAWFGVCSFPLDYGNPSVRELTEYMVAGFIVNQYSDGKRNAYLSHFDRIISPRLHGCNRYIEKDGRIAGFLKEMQEHGNGDDAP